MTRLSEIARIADDILSAVEKHSSTGTIMGGIKTMLHQTPDFVVGMKELIETVKEVTKEAEEPGFFWGIEDFRVHGSLSTVSLFSFPVPWIFNFVCFWCVVYVLT